MSNMIYLSIKGKIQGLILEGCDSYASIGNKYRINHVDEIFVLRFDYPLGRKYNVIHHPIKFYKPIGKSSPLLNAALSENEELSAIFNLYRINSGGYIKRLYTIGLQEAHLPNILACYPHSITHAGSQPEDVIVLNYKNMTWKRHVAGAESCSYWEKRIF